MYKKSFMKTISFSSKWQEVFLVISNIGILVFNKPGEAKSSLIPVSGANLVMV